ncbi:MAG TPA: hypothetical protein P5080_01855 [Candidatus Paceibacterota bacterium]|nr:hypothetical protein [Candidatus Paceibacterota bacterium]HSA36437.1 hypothetical protein [Candidatus Paceibacterota bacterium]
MNKNNTAKISFVFGIISLLLMVIFNYYFITNLYANYIKTNLLFEFLIPNFYNLAWLFSVLGIIFGAIGLKSEKRKLAVAGIVLSGTGLFGYLMFFLLLWMKFSGV